MEQMRTFDPSRYLINVKGQQYLEVKWRLVWLRNVFPDASVSTELVSEDNGRAIFKAKATLPNGASATGWGSETWENFPDYIEKAETKALGRCLAALGFGSQFCTDFDFGADQGKVVDAPVRPLGQQDDEPAPAVSIDQPMTSRQYGLIQVLAKELRLSAADLDDLAVDRAGTKTAGLSRRQASALIEELKDRAGKATANAS